MGYSFTLPYMPPFLIMPFYKKQTRSPLCPYCMDGEIVLLHGILCCNRCNYIVEIKK